MSSNRALQLAEPVGPAISYYGPYTVQGANQGFTIQIQQSTFPQWVGTASVRTITELSASSLKFVAAPIRDPQGGEFHPHLEFERVR